MKHLFLAIAAVISLCSCAGTRVTNTQVATGAMSPKKIFIRPFGVGEFRGAHGGEAMKTILHSQAGNEFAEILKGELAKIAPTTVLADDEAADGGWLIEGELQVVDAGCPIARVLFGRLGVGRSGILVHVRITDAGRKASHDGKGGTGNTIYEFDVAGGSRLTHGDGNEHAPGTGYAPAFDYRNAAERIACVLEPDRHAYGLRTSSPRQ
jgi:hypothetical protein